MKLQRVELDPDRPFAAQLEVDSQPVTVIVHYGVQAQHRQAFIEAWAEESRYMTRQPGFISVQMYQAVGDGPEILEVATWESASHLKAAVMSDGHRQLLEGFPPCTSSPHLLDPVGASGVCPGGALR